MLYSIHTVSPFEVCILLDGRKVVAKAFLCRGRGWEIYAIGYRHLGRSRWKRDILIAYALCRGRWLPEGDLDAFSVLGHCPICREEALFCFGLN